MDEQLVPRIDMLEKPIAYLQIQDAVGGAPGVPTKYVFKPGLWFDAGGNLRIPDTHLELDPAHDLLHQVLAVKARYEPLVLFRGVWTDHWPCEHTSTGTFFPVSPAYNVAGSIESVIWGGAGHCMPEPWDLSGTTSTVAQVGVFHPVIRNTAKVRVGASCMQ